MLKWFYLNALALLLIVSSTMANDSIKNVILLIPDGASSDLLALTRWYNGNKPLALDELICGMVKTHSADSTIADSAPSGTAYATGFKSKTRYIGVDHNRIPRISLLELAKRKGLATGIVVTCQFPHATPADFVCHYPIRDAYDILSKQFVYNSPTVVFGGGYRYINQHGLQTSLDSMGIRVIRNKESFQNIESINNKPVWALFDDWNGRNKYMSYSCDRNDDQEPSLAEMTQKAIEILSKNPNGFFMMVEGSQIDWAAHANDPKAIVSDFLAFDESVRIALDFAKRNRNTIVVVCPDHGNGGVSIGNHRSGDLSSNPFKYDKINIHKQIIEPLWAVKHSSRWVVENLLEKIDSKGQVTIGSDAVLRFIKENYSVEFSPLQIEKLTHSLRWVKMNPKANSNSIDDTLSKVMVSLGRELSNNLFIGWTTTGHTSEDVFLGVFSPNGQRPSGVIDNTDVFHYISNSLMKKNWRMTEEAKSFQLMLPNATFGKWKRVGNNPLTFVKGKNRLVLPLNTNHYILNGKAHEINSLTLSFDEIYYVDEKVLSILKE